MHLVWARTIKVILIALTVVAQSKDGSSQNSSSFDPNGTAHVSRVIPLPSTVSPEARKWLASLPTQKQGDQTLAEKRVRTDEWRLRDAVAARKIYPVNIEGTAIAGVKVDLITPIDMPEGNRKRVLINLHGGGFIVDSGSLVEGIPIANLTGTKVVSVYYRLAPENPFPAAVDDAVAVYKELLKTYKAANIGIFGTSAGATLTCEVAVRLKQLGVDLPAALGIFSVHPDFSRPTDSQAIFSLNGLSGDLQPKDPNLPPADLYPGTADRKNPVLSPLFADLKGMPPSLLVTSTRDLLLSDTAMFHRALLHAGVDAQLVVFEALPHAFWYQFDLPETREALQMMADFFNKKVER